MCHIIAIEPIIKNGPFIPMTIGQRKPENQWTGDERKAANLDQRLKSLIMSVLPDDQMNSIINCLTTKSTWDDLILYHEGPYDVKESRVMDLKLCYNTFKFKEGESLTQTFTRYKALLNELVNDCIKLSKLEINTGFINGLPKKWLSFCQSLRNINHVKDKLKYEENLKDSIYETENNKSLVSATPLSTAFLSSFIVQDFQDSPDDEEDTRSSQEYLNDLENTNHVKESELASLFGKLKYKENLINSIYNTNQEKTLVHATPLSIAFFSSSIVQDFQDIPDNEEDTRSSLAVQKHLTKLNATNVARKDKEEVSSDDYDVTEVKALMALADEERVSVGKESVRNGEWIKISMKKVHTLLEMEDNDDRKSFLDYLCIDLNYVKEQRNNLMSKHINLVQELNTCKEQLLVSKQAKLDLLIMQHVNTEILKENQNLRNELKELTSITEAWLNSSNKVNHSGPKDNSEVSITGSNKPKLSEAKDSTPSNHDTGKHPLPPLEKLTGAKLVSGPKTIKSILKSKSTFKAETLKGITINEPSSTPAKGKKSSSVFKTNSAPADHKSDDYVYYPICEICGSYDHDTHDHNMIISLRRGTKPKNPQQVTKSTKTSGSNVHTTSDHNDIEWFRKREALQAKKVNVTSGNLLSRLNNCRSTQILPAQIWDVPGPEGMYGNNSTYTTEGYGYGIVFKKEGK
ncbi:hypothetical protein Tco_0123163 [Tanacetum coccineum]